jgi:hypothetical protein
MQLANVGVRPKARIKVRKGNWCWQFRRLAALCHEPEPTVEMACSQIAKLRTIGRQVGAAGFPTLVPKCPIEDALGKPRHPQCRRGNALKASLMHLKLGKLKDSLLFPALCHHRRSCSDSYSLGLRAWAATVWLNSSGSRVQKSRPKARPATGTFATATAPWIASSSSHSPVAPSILVYRTCTPLPQPEHPQCRLPSRGRCRTRPHPQHRIFPDDRAVGA